MERVTDGTETSIGLPEIRQRSRVKKILEKMMKYKEVLCILLTSVIVFLSRTGQSFHQKQIQKTAPTPHRFFPSHSNVVDYPFGNLAPVIKLLEDEELIFVMYYAPWSAESVRVRGEFIKAARVIGDVIKFVGVNCWWSNGVCRESMKFLSYPELFIYHTGVRDGYRFSGIHEAEYFVRFAESFINPLQQLHTSEEIDDFVAQQDNTVVGYFDFNTSPQPPGTPFHQFYLSALRVMSYGLYQPVKFGVVLTKRLAEYFDITKPNRFVLFRAGNTTLKYPVNYNMTCRNMSGWIWKNKRKNFATWLVPPGVKSLTLSLPMKQGPVLFMYAPSNPLMEQNFYLNLLRELSLEYRNCEENIYLGAEELIYYSIENRKEMLEKEKKLIKRCQNRQRMKVYESTPKYSSKCCMCVLTGANQDSKCEYCVSSVNKDRESVCDISWKSESSWFPAQVCSCANAYQFYNVNEHRSLCCNNCNSGISQNLFLEVGKTGRKKIDPFVIHGEERTLQRHCNKLTLQKLKRVITLDNFARFVRNKMFNLNVGNFTGLQCRTNRTLNFYYLDSHYHSAFAERLGITVSSTEPKVIIIDLKNEALYHLREKFTLKNIAQFVLNFTEGSLQHHIRSLEVVSPSECDPALEAVCIVEVTSQTFQKTVMDNTKDVVLLYYTPWCGFCSEFAGIYLAAAEYFKKNNNNIIFARINGDANDLPWAYTVETYPTILFFPAQRNTIRVSNGSIQIRTDIIGHRIGLTDRTDILSGSNLFVQRLTADNSHHEQGKKSESILFAEDEEKSLSNLVKFLLFHTNTTVQLDIAMSMCTSQCIQKNIARVIEKTSSLERSVRQLDRRAKMLWSHVAAGSLDYVQMARETTMKMFTIRQKQLKKVQMLNYFLQKDLRKSEKDLPLLQDMISNTR